MITVTLRCYGTDTSYMERRFEFDGLSVADVLHRVEGRSLWRYTTPSHLGEQATIFEDGGLYLIHPKDRERTERLLLDLSF